MLKHQGKKDTVYQYILQTHQHTIKRYLDLAPGFKPEPITTNKSKPINISTSDRNPSFNPPNTAI
jgi:hypothetical protein